MEYTATAITRCWSLDELTIQLNGHDSVVGVLQIGSLADSALTPASDYDLVIVVRELPQPWYVGVTQVDHRFTDLIFVAASEVARVAVLAEPIGPDDALAPIARWIEHGTIVFDRDGQLDRAQQHLRQADWVRTPDDQAPYGAWFAINYNLAQARRMFAAESSLYQTTLEIRMAVYGPADLWFGYFSLRGISFEGDKAAVKYLLEHDPEFLDGYRQFIAESDPERKLVLYKRVAAHTTAPLGGLWPPDVTVMNVLETLDIWQRLLT